MSENGAKQFRVIPGMSATTALLVQHMRKCRPGDEFTDEELREICGQGCSPGQRGYANLQTAIKYCEREGVVWGRIRKGGKIKCLEPDEVMSGAEGSLKHIRRKARRTTLQLGSIPIEALSEAEVVKRNAYIAQSGALELFAERRTSKKLQSQKATAFSNLDKGLELFD